MNLKKREVLYRFQSKAFYYFAILAELFASLFGRIFSRLLATGVAIFPITVYAMLVGASPAVVPATLMSSIAMKTTPEQGLTFTVQAITYAPEDRELEPSGHNWLNTQPGI